MSTNFASLGIEVNSSSAAKAADDLDKLVDSAVDAEKAIDDLGKTGAELAGTGKKIVQAEREVAQEIDKSADATQRQTEARRKSGASAASEIAIISQLDKAMSGNIGSIEQLVQAEGLLERARKGGLVTIEQQEAYQERLGKAYDKIAAAETKEIAQKQRLIEAESRQIEALKRTVNGIDPVVAKLAKLEAQEKALNDLHKAGGIDAAAYAARLAKIGKDRAGVTEVTSAFDKLKLGTRQAQENVMQLTNALQSGDWGSGARAVAQLGAGAGASAKSMAALLLPAGLLAGVLGGIGYAYFDAMKQAREFNAAINGGSNDAGQTIASLKVMSETAGLLTGNLSGAREAVVALASGAATSSVQMENLAQAAAAISEVTGKGAGDIAKSLADAGNTATEAASKISAQYGLLTYEQYEVIKAIDDQGDHQRALDTLSESLNQSAQERLKAYRASLSDVERDWDNIKIAITGAYAAIRSEIFPDLAKQIEITQRVLDTRKGGGVAGAVSNGLSSINSFLGLGDGDNDDSTAALEAKLAGLKARQSASQNLGVTTGETTHANKELIAVQKDLDKQMENLNPLAKRQEAYKKLNDQFTKLYQDAEKTGQKASLLDGVEFDGKKFSGGAYDKLKKAIEDGNKDPKSGSGSVDLTGFNDAKNQLTAIVAEYSNAQKQLDAAQKAGLISQADYALKREALIGNERDEVTAAYEAEIAALEAVKNKSSTTAAQRIQLDQKIADARSSMLKAQKDADSQLEVLATNEEGRIKRQTAASKAYVDQLERQRVALETSGTRAANGLGLGDRQQGLQNSLDGATDKFNDERAKLLDRRRTAPDKYSMEDYEKDLANLQTAENSYRDTVVGNYDKMTAAQSDWQSGATSAYANYLESANNVSGQTKSLFTNAFSSMEDAIVNFAMTGKLSFADFAKSILADMARIAARQASSAALSGLFGLAANTAGSYFGGGAQNVGSSASASGYSTSGYAGAYGFDGGGYTGDGGKHEPAGIVHKGEVVIRKEVVQQQGMRGYLERLNKRGYADGGYVGSSGSQAAGDDGGKASTQIIVNVDARDQGDSGINPARLTEAIKVVCRQEIAMSRRNGGQLT